MTTSGNDHEHGRGTGHDCEHDNGHSRGDDHEHGRSHDRASDAPAAPRSTTQALATLFFRNPHLLWLTIVVIFVGGLASVQSLPRLEDPRIVNRGPIVLTQVPGATADRVESLVTDVIEESLDEIDAIKDISSTSRPGMSVISIELEESVTAANNQALFSEIRDQVAEAADRLPPEALDPIVDDKRDPTAWTLIVGLTWTSSQPVDAAPLGRLAEDLADRLRSIPGTELVRRYGEPDEEITVTVDPAELASLGLTAMDVAARLGAADVKQPAGIVRGPSTDVVIEVEGELDSVARVAAVPLVVAPGGAVRTVGDVADVQRGVRTPPASIGVVNGHRSVIVAARVTPDVRVDRWAERAQAVLTDFEASRAAGIRVDRVFEQEPYTTDRLATLAENLLAGAGVILVAIFLIMGVRSSFIVAAALPLVVSLVMLGWMLSGGQIHQMSVFGLIIALGLLIDNAIVVTDDVVAAKARGASPVEAVAAAVRHLFLPLLASTITTVLAFAPIMLLPGSAGDFVGSIGTSVVLAIIASFAVSMTVIAALAGRFGRPAPADGPRRWWRDGVAPAWLTGRFRRTLRFLLARPVAAIAISLTLPIAGFAIAPTLGNQFFPPVDRNMFEVRVEMPRGTAIDATRARATEIEATIRDLGDVTSVAWLVGGSFPSVYYNLMMRQDRAPAYAHGVITTTSAAATKRLVDEAQLALSEAHPEARVLVRAFAQGPPVVADIEYRLFGPDRDQLQAFGDAYRRALQAHPDVIHTEASIPRGTPQLRFDVDEDAVHLAGLTLGDVAQQLDAALEGRSAGRVLEDLEQVPVRVRVGDATRGALDAVASTLIVPGASVAGGSGGGGVSGGGSANAAAATGTGASSSLTDPTTWVPASTLGPMVLEPELGAIERYNGRRTNTIRAYVRDGALPIDVGQSVLASLAAGGFELPPGYELEIGGASEQDAEANANLATYAPVLATLMVATLVLVFRSVRAALMLGGVVVTSLGLALLSTWSIDFPISFNTILGTLGLIGVALNDSIVVLASIRSNPRAMAGDVDELVAAVMSCARHVLATTATTIGGFLPLLLFVGGDFWPSLAIVLVGGIAGASLVAVLFIPATHVLLHPRRTPPASATVRGSGTPYTSPAPPSAGWRTAGASAGA